MIFKNRCSINFEEKCWSPVFFKNNCFLALKEAHLHLQGVST